MKKYEPTAESLAAHTALVRAKEAFDTRLEAFTQEAVIAIDDIANHIGKPIWHEPTGVFMGDVTGYLFDYDDIDESFTIEGYLYADVDDPSVQKEVTIADMTFDEPKPAPKPRKTKGKADAAD